MEPTLPNFDFSESNPNLLFKAFPDDKSSVALFGHQCESTATSFEIEETDLELCIYNLYKLWAYLIYYQPKEDYFRQNLAQVGITVELQDKFIELWINDGTSTVEKVSKYTCTGIPRVEDVHCSTQMRLSNNASTEVKESEITLHLNTDQGDKKVVLSREQAIHLYKELNNVQAALDKLVE